MQSKVNNLEKAIAALQGQRAALGDAAVEASIAALQKQLAQLKSQAEPPEQQRKLATILFTDVVGSTRIAQQLDPEEVVDVMDAALKRLAGPVEGHGGHVTRFQGDGFKAVFGLPVAHENDPEMAIRAGLGILETAQEIAKELKRERGIPDFRVRVGINTGRVAAGGQTEAEDTVMGEAVNLAARLESAAPPGGLLISHNTCRHVRGVFNVVAAEPVSAKGFPEPVPVYLVHSAKPRAFRVQSRGVEGVETRMVGRQTELKLLRDALLIASEDSEGQVVTVLGEAGVGKSRLLYEFQNWIELLTQLVRLYPARARPETQNLPYALLRDLFASRFQIQDGDPPESVREKFELGMAEAFQSSTLFEANTPLLGQLLGIDFSSSPHLKGLLGDPQALRNRALEAMIDYFTSVCRSDPVVIFLEDLHWADDSSLDAINTFGRRIQDLPVLVVALARPSLLERRPHWGEGQLYHRKIHLEPLSKRESRQLVEEILQKIEQVPLALRELVVSGAEGNPFYIEELVKMLVEQGVIVKGEERWGVEVERLAQVDVPSTLTGVLQARLDSLPKEERTVLQRASVVGRVFWDRVLEHLQRRSNGGGEDITPRLAGLRDKEMVFRREDSIIAQAHEYIFKHEILREVTYESVLKKLRPRYHSWVADWLIQQRGEGGEEYSGLIADHLEQAGRKDEARHYLSRAGQAALASYANVEAARYFRRALALNPAESDRSTLLGGLAEALQRQGFRDEAVTAWREGIDLYKSQGNLEGVACYYAAWTHSLLPFRPAEAVEHSKAGMEAVEGLADTLALGHLLHQYARASLSNQYARASLSNWNSKQAEGLCQQALEIAERLGDLELQADALVTMGNISDNLEETLIFLNRGIQLAEDHNFLYVATKGYGNLGGILTGLYYDHRAALHHYLRALEIARHRGVVDQVAFYLVQIVNIQLNLGNFTAADQQLRELERVAQAMPHSVQDDWGYQEAKIRIKRLRGQLDEALELIQENLAKTRNEKDIWILRLYLIDEYIPLLLDLHRYRGWRDLASIQKLMEEIMKSVGEKVRGDIRSGMDESFLSFIYARRGLTEESRLWLQRAQEVLFPFPNDYAPTPPVEAAIELAVAEARWVDAFESVKWLLDLYTRTGMRWDEAHTLLELGEIHRMRGLPEDREQALDLYGRAMQMFTEIGAPGYVDIVQGRLQTLQ